MNENEKKLEAILENTENSMDDIKKDIENEAMENIDNYIKECKENNTELDIKHIKEFITNGEVEYRKLKRPFSSMVQILKDNKEFFVREYPIANKSVFQRIKDIDKITFFRDAFITIGGNSSSGKTSLVTQMIKDLMIANSNAVCLFYSLDDGAYFGMRKAFQHFTDFYHKTKNDNQTNFELPNYTEAISENYLDHFNTDLMDAMERIIILDKYDHNHIRTDIEDIKRTFKNKKKYNEKTKKEELVIIIALDYLQILSNKTSIDNKNFYSDIMDELKSIQQAETKDNGCIFFMLSQLNRTGSKSGDVGLNDFRETSDIENLSDLAITIDYSKTDKKLDYTKTDRVVKIVKNKLGGKKNYTVKVNHGVITSLEDKDKSNITPLEHEHQMLENEATSINDNNNNIFENEIFSTENLDEVFNNSRSEKLDKILNKSKSKNKK